MAAFRPEPARLGYRPALDGVRALAIMPVVALHAFGWPSEGSLGVDLFFVLSGFLITVLLLEERAATGRIAVGLFWRRRAARLAPALLVMLAIYAIVARGSHAWALVFGATYVSNIANAAAPAAIPWSLGHLWSLAQEEQFYLVWPLLVIAILKLRPQLLTRVLLALIAAALLEQVALLAIGASWQRLYFGPDVHSQPILVGCLAGALFVARGLPVKLAQHASLIGALLASAVVAMIVLPADWSPVTGTSPLRIVFAATCALLVVVAAGAGVRALSALPAVFLGKISYSVYLWHVPILAAVAARPNGTSTPRELMAVALALTVATASFQLVERPIRSRFARPSAARRPDRAAATAGAVAASARP
jgi:peptidoglycan/LPS O-acetylase OafA/YrhL